MKTTIKSIVSTIGLMTLLVGTSSHASTYSLSSFASIDLNTTSFVTVSGDASFLPLFGNEFTDAIVSANGAHLNSDVSFASLSVNEDGGAVNTTASTSPLTLLSTTDVAHQGFGDAAAEYILDYTISGSGQIEISVPYQISIDAVTATTTDPGSNAFSQVSIEDESSFTGDSQFLDWFQGSNNGPIDNLGSLTFLIDVNDGDAGSLRFFTETGADLFTPATVPLPPSGLLLLSSLFGITMARSRRRQT